MKGSRELQGNYMFISCKRLCKMYPLITACKIEMNHYLDKTKIRNYILTNYHIIFYENFIK